MRRRPFRHFGLVLPVAALLVHATSGAAGLAAQERRYAPEEQRWLGTGWPGDVLFAGANALLTGVVTGLFREIRDDGTFSAGFRAGIAGGLVSYAGKRIASERFDGAGLLGRQVASLGGSMAANAREARGPFDRLILQLGVARLHWDRVESRVSVRPDMVTLTYTALALADARVELDWDRTLSAGAPIFITTSGAGLDEDAAGRAFGGVAIVDRHASIPIDEIVAHERIHILQHDQHHALWAAAVERKLVSMLGERATSTLGRADLGLALITLAPLQGVLSRGSNPLEIEADFLTVR